MPPQTRKRSPKSPPKTCPIVVFYTPIQKGIWPSIRQPTLQPPAGWVSEGFEGTLLPEIVAQSLTTEEWYQGPCQTAKDMITYLTAVYRHHQAQHHCGRFVIRRDPYRAAHTRRKRAHTSSSSSSSSSSSCTPKTKPSYTTPSSTTPLTSYPRYNFESATRWTPQKCRTFLQSGTIGSQRTNLKPDGRWYSVYASWNAWGEVSHGRFVHKLTFVPNVHTTLSALSALSALSTPSKPSSSPSSKRVLHRSSLLVLRTLSEVQQFNDIYGSLQHRRDAFIRWKDVAQDYGGIEFRHYKSIAREIRKNGWMDRYLWYLSLDCSCGCVWDIGLVKGIAYVGVNHVV